MGRSGAASYFSHSLAVLLPLPAFMETPATQDGCLTKIVPSGLYLSTKTDELEYTNAATGFMNIVS